MRGCDICPPPIKNASPKVKRAKRQKLYSISNEQSKEVVADNEDGDTGPKDELECSFIYYLRDDGLWLKVGDIVSVEGVGKIRLPLFGLTVRQRVLTFNYLNFTHSSLLTTYLNTFVGDHVLQFLLAQLT